MTDRKHLLLEPLRLSNGVELKDRILPGPMEGILTPVFCKALIDYGFVHSWITPFYRVTTGVTRYSKLKLFLGEYYDFGLPTIVQLMGNNGPLMGQTAKRFLELGAHGINLNFACPSKTVVSNCAGGAMLKEPQSMRRILEDIREECPDTSISLKIRMGFEDYREFKNILKEVLPVKPDFIFFTSPYD